MLRAPAPESAGDPGFESRRAHQDSKFGIMWISLQSAPQVAPAKPGVYLVRLVRDGRPVEIPRFRGVDRSGIVYIGSTGNLRRRLRELVTQLERLRPECGRYSPHTAALTYHLFSWPGLGIGIGNFEVSWVEFSDARVARRQELLALRRYAEKFGETPPLNMSLRRRGLPCIEEDLDPRLARLIG